MKTELGKFNNDITNLVPLTEFNYENIFQVYQDGDFFSYNILRKVNMPDDMDPEFFDWVEVTAGMAWTIISYREYGTILLWWLVCATNKIQNPTALPTPGTILKLIKPKYVRVVLDEIKKQLKT